METWTILTYPPSVMESSGFRVIAEHVEEDHVLLLLVFADLSVFLPPAAAPVKSEPMQLIFVLRCRILVNLLHLLTRTLFHNHV